MRQKNLFKRGISVILASVTCFSLLGGVMNCGLTVKADTSGISNPRIAEDGTVTWDKVEFGSYYQNINEIKTEPIKWRILSVNEDGTDAFLLADEILDGKNYNDAQEDVTWKTSTLRKWLNDTESGFLKEAFTAEEQAAIDVTTVINSDNSTFGTDGGNNTNDKVYLLSIDEAINPEYGFDDKGYSFSHTRFAKTTDYAYLNRVRRENNAIWDYNSKYEYVKKTDLMDNASWWLRSPGNSSGTAVYVHQEGWLNIEGGVVFNNILEFNRGGSVGVRPVLHTNLNTSYVKDAGKVTSDGKVILPEQEGYSDDGYVKPETNDPGITKWDCVYFGSYKQGASFNKKPIEWRVLSVDEDTAVLITDKAIDCKQYYDTQTTGVTWETSTLRKWLNDEDNGFINDAFTSKEQDSINTVTLINDDNAINNTAGGNDTNDKVYLLSIDEASKTEYGFDNTIINDSSFNINSLTRQTKVTDYAYIKGAYRSNDTDYAGNGYWWLRSPGGENYRAILVNNAGMVSSGGYYVDVGTCAVRPVIQVDLKTANLTVVGNITAKGKASSVSEAEQQEIAAAAKVDELILGIGTVTINSREAINAARAAYDALATDSAKARVTKYDVLQAAESKLADIEKNANNNGITGSDNSTDKKSDTVDNKKENPTTKESEQHGQNVTDKKTKESTDNRTTFNIKNKKTYKKSKKVTIKDKDGIKSVKLNGKKVKVKSGKKSISFKLSKYKNYLKRKNRWNKLVITDVKKNKKSLQFKVK